MTKNYNFYSELCNPDRVIIGLANSGEIYTINITISMVLLTEYSFYFNVIRLGIAI